MTNTIIQPDPTINAAFNNLTQLTQLTHLDQSDILIALTIFSFALLTWGGVRLRKYFQNRNQVPEEPKIDEQLINLNEGQDAIAFLERLIKDKYQYYLYQDLLPIYLDSKIPERTIVKKVKGKIYASIVGSLTRGVKQELLRFFTEKGIEIFVNERIITLMNETDFRSSDKLSESFREITANNVERII